MSILVLLDVESALEESFNGKVCPCIEVVEAYG
ncbi:hypothetical protein HNQ71_003352 [Mesorhizobium sangaii]|uniref:Uncharacterized protein n=1 Tax=Mesorhizobium sangaii TaxID=505389 RepID=A0A841PD65_9HYPH|nr:hypothetical protein [Mesorhizobium sangaii]